MNPNSISTSPLSTSTDIPADAISRLAYELWEAEGRPDGCDVRHWLQAEQELNGRPSSYAQPLQVGGNGSPQNGGSASSGSTGTDARPLQGTRAGAAAARDTKRPPAPTEKPGMPSSVNVGRRK